MGRGFSEPQFTVTANLAPQIIEGGIFIPEHISIDLHLGDLGNEFFLYSDGAGGAYEHPGDHRERIALRRLLDVTADNILAKLRLDNRIQAVLYALRHGLASQS